MTWTNCSSCQNTRTLRENTCKCIDGTLESNESCTPCHSSCLTCANSTTNCLTCNSTLLRELSLNSCNCISTTTEVNLNCVLCSSLIPYCLQCLNSKDCKVCQSGFVLDKFGNCKCPSGKYLNSNKGVC